MSKELEKTSEIINIVDNMIKQYGDPHQVLYYKASDK